LFLIRITQMANLFTVSHLLSVTVSDVNKTTTHKAKAMTFKARAKAWPSRQRPKQTTFKAKPRPKPSRPRPRLRPS